MNIVVVGDVIVDKYRYISPSLRRDANARDGEVIYDDRGEFNRIALGGAAGVAQLIQGSHRHTVTLASTIGSDDNGDTAIHRLESADINTVVHRQGNTTRKTRFVSIDSSGCESVWASRIDYDAHMRLPREARVSLGQAFQTAHLIVVVDHGKGLMRPLLPVLQSAKAPVLVDPAQTGCWTDYGSVDCIKATAAELNTRVPESVSTSPVCEQIEAIRDAANHWVITDGSRGLHYSSRSTPGWCRHLEADPVDRVIDTAGCGDTVMACLALGWADGLDFWTICTRAVRAAALQTQYVGVMPDVISEAY